MAKKKKDPVEKLKEEQEKQIGESTRNAGSEVAGTPGGDAGVGQSSIGSGAITLGSATVRAEATVITYPQRLLVLAKALINGGEFGTAVLVAHVACEIATDRAFTKALAAKGLGYLEEPIGAYFSGTLLTQDRNRDLFNALTGDEIQKKPFWDRIRRSVTRRNGIAQKGVIVSKPDAEESLTAATEFVAYLEK